MKMHLMYHLENISLKSYGVDLTPGKRLRVFLM